MAIYSAAFASAVGSHIYCPAVSQNSRPQNDAAVNNNNNKDNKDNDDDDDYAVGSSPEQDAVQKCESSFATEAVMQICHGKSKKVILFQLFNSLGADINCPKVKCQRWQLI